MARMLGAALAVLLALSVAPLALAAAPTIFQESGRGSGIDGSLSAACGVEVSFTDDWRFTVVDMGERGYDVHFTARRSFTGPGGSVEVRIGYSFGADQPVEAFEDETTGTFTEIYRETYRGTATTLVPGEGIVDKTAGTLYSEVTIVYPPDGEPIVTVQDATGHGIQPDDVWSGPSDATLCQYLT